MIHFSDTNMASIRIFTDTNSDLTKEMREQYRIEYFKMCNVIDGEVIPADLDWTRFSPKEFYDILREGKKKVSTTQVPAEDFRARFTECAKAGDTVIYVACALPLSSSVNTAAVVARDVMAEYPDAKIYCVDSKNVCMGEGLLAILAAELRDAGKSAEEIVAAIEEKRHFVNMFVTVGSLDRLKKTGRVKGSAAFFGNLLGVKPIIISDYNGQNVPIKKVKGRKPSIDEVVNLVREVVIDPAGQTVYIEHADCIDDVTYFKEQLMALGFADAVVTDINPIVGACIGPGAIGVWCYGKKVELAV